jgi:hypothetical protein
LRAARTGAEVNFSVMPFDDDPVGDNESQSRARPALGGDERNGKDERPGLGRNSIAIVSISPRKNSTSRRVRTSMLPVPFTA